MAGISRVHGGLLAPKNFAGVGLTDFYITFASADSANVWADYAGANGTAGNSATTGTSAGQAFDQLFRVALSQFATISRVGSLNTSAVPYTMNFALETLGVDQFSPGYLGLGPTDGSPNTSTYRSLTDAVQALGRVNGISLNSATVSVGVISNSVSY